MRKLIIVLLGFLLALVPIGGVSAYNYNLTWYSNFPDGDQSNMMSFTPSIRTSADSCYAIMTPYVNMNVTASTEITTSYYSPHDTLVGISSRNITNASCLNMGTISKDSISANGTYEARISTIGGANGITNLRTMFSCTTDSEWLSIYFNDNVTDTRSVNPGYYVTGIQGTYLNYTDAIALITTDTFGPCQELNISNIGVGMGGYAYPDCTPWAASTCRPNKVGIKAVSAELIFTVYTLIPFKTGSIGEVNITIKEPNLFNCSSGCNSVGSPAMAAFVYPLDNPASNFTLCSFSGTLDCNAEITLEGDKDYVLLVANQFIPSAAVESLMNYNPDIQLDINVYEPDYECGGWSDCESGVQTRVCIDADGIAPDKIETRGCYSTPDEELWLGFYGGTSVDVWYCQMGWACDSFAQIKTVEYPDDWYVYNVELNYTGYTGVTPAANTTAYAFDYVRLSNEYSADGDPMSLKMWYIPPKAHQVEALTTNNDTDYVICTNRTIGSIPYTTHSVNETLFVEHNVTFPSPYMTLYFNVRRCALPEFQCTAPNLFGWAYCGVPDLCYTSTLNCTISPKARYRVVLLNADTNAIVFESVDNVLESSVWEGREYQIDELNITGNYTLRFQIMTTTGNNIESQSYCMYLDNVNFYVRDAGYPSCESFCDEDEYGLLHQAIEIDGACKFTEVPLSPICVSPDIVDLVDDEENFCDPGCANASYRYYVFNNDTKVWETIENSDYCEEWCDDYEQEQSITEALEAEQYTEFASMFLAPLFLSIIISLALGTFVALKSKNGLMGAISVMVMLLGFTAFGYFPSWLFIIIIILTGLVFGKQFVGMISNR